MLNICRQPLGLIYDDETRIFFTENIRGGIVQAGAKRHATANNKYMQSYDPKNESTFISYLDMNSLYGTAMTQPIPYKLLDEVDLKLLLNVDGTIKKVIIIGDNADLNKLVEEAVKEMVWNASVKAGLTIKSEVRMILKFDKES